MTTRMNDKRMMRRRDFLFGTAALVAYATVSQPANAFWHGKPAGVNYFVSAAGSDSNNGTSTSTPWLTVGKVNGSTFNPGDTISFRGGDTFTDARLTPPSSGAAGSPIIFTSYGTGRATIAPTSLTSSGYKVIDKSNVTMDGINYSSAGSTGVGVYLSAQTANSQNIICQNFTVTGYKDGFDVGGDVGSFGFSNVLIQNFAISGCSGGAGGSYGSGGSGVKVHSNITVQNGTATTCLQGGISLGNVDGGVMQNVVCSACGASSTVGPAGLWTFESNNVVIKFCESFGQLSGTAQDGDGFDIDGGCTNCVIEYCYSHGNAGAGYTCFNYDGPGPWNNNTIRYCIGQNNGRAGTFYGEVTIEARTSIPCTNVLIYNNTFYNNLDISAVVCLPAGGVTGHTGHVANNIFYSAANTPLISSDVNASGLSFTGNDYFASGTFGISWNGTSYTSFSAWQTATAQEKISGINVGLTSDPTLNSPGGGGTVGGYVTTQPSAYFLKLGSPCIGTGLDLNAKFSITPGAQDFYSNAIPRSGVFPVGAYGAVGV